MFQFPRVFLVGEHGSQKPVLRRLTDIETELSRDGLKKIDRDKNRLTGIERGQRRLRETGRQRLTDIETELNRDGLKKIDRDIQRLTGIERGYRRLRETDKHLDSQKQPETQRA